jgi:hypothetical protein
MHRRLPTISYPDVAAGREVLLHNVLRRRLSLYGHSGRQACLDADMKEGKGVLRRLPMGTKLSNLAVHPCNKTTFGNTYFH